MKEFLTYKGCVLRWECDSNGHLNVMYYINKFENGGHNLMLEIGLTSYIADRKGTLGSVVLEQNINYYKEVFEDDVLYINSKVLGLSNKTITVEHVMFNGMTKEEVAKMRVVLVLFDKVKRRALPIPSRIKKELTKLIAQ